MQTRTYIAPTKLEALLKIREELGPDAVVLSERTIQKGRLFGRKPMVEITVGLKESEAQGKVEPKGIEAIDPTQTRLRRLERELGELKELVQKLLLAGDSEVTGSTVASQAVVAPNDEHPLLRPLLSTGIEIEVARELLRRVPRIPHNVAVDALRRTLMARISVGGVLPRESRSRQVVALVGPTGVGKTTTLAKLAAIHALDYNRRVALLSLDTYRIGAVDQLRTYASIMSLPLHIATTPEEVQDGLEQFRQYDLILIDTIGRGQRDEAHLTEMHRALMPTNAQTYLVLSATSDTAVLYESVQRFAIFEPESLILTKTDEAVRFGNCINLCMRVALPIAYFTTGQRVPEDIQPAEARWLACKVLANLQECPARDRPLAFTHNDMV